MTDDLSKGIDEVDARHHVRREQGSKPVLSWIAGIIPADSADVSFPVTVNHWR